MSAAPARSPTCIDPDMRIDCPHCGERDLREFMYLGDASVQRPDPHQPDALERFTAYVYLRDNPAGPLRELWYHAACQAWLVVTRDTRNHDILGVESLKPRTLGAPTGSPP
jgi:heterotetrameric sarcosine oxidase delta subunit